jgi:hypothetical protein
MTKYITILLLILTAPIFTYSQLSPVPDGIIFQGVATDAKGNPASNRKIYVKNAILQQSATGPTLYAESFEVMSSVDGVFTIVIGKGKRTSGVNSLNQIDFEKGPFFLNIKSAVAPTVPLTNWNPDDQFVDMGTSQFWTVPFAMYASKVEGFDLKLNAADTSAMLNKRIARDTLGLSKRLNDAGQAINRLFTQELPTIQDSLKLLRNLLAQKLDWADTAQMLNARFSRDTLGLSNRIEQRVDLYSNQSIEGVKTFQTVVTPSLNGLSIGVGRGRVHSLIVSGNAQLSGSNTGDQTITLQGDVTGTGTEQIATVISDAAVTASKIASNSVSGDKLTRTLFASIENSRKNILSSIKLTAAPGQVLNLDASENVVFFIEGEATIGEINGGVMGKVIHIVNINKEHYVYFPHGGAISWNVSKSNPYGKYQIDYEENVSLIYDGTKWLILAD